MFKEEGPHCHNHGFFEDFFVGTNQGKILAFLQNFSEGYRGYNCEYFNHFFWGIIGAITIDFLKDISEGLSILFSNIYFFFFLNFRMDYVAIKIEFLMTHRPLRNFCSHKWVLFNIYIFLHHRTHKKGLINQYSCIFQRIFFSKNHRCHNLGLFKDFFKGTWIFRTSAVWLKRVYHSLRLRYMFLGPDAYKCEDNSSFGL